MDGCFWHGCPKCRRWPPEENREYVGPAGRLLDRLLAFAGFSRAEVCITNVVKCRPPGNRLPAPQQVAACRPYLLG
ncbi:MAG: hypothetical protein H5U01_03110 [Clostridia bacterium]|nr:hypothetical protein [Clostridia bacterium]MBC7346932.1 hypothetical protein [Clostridia bacterium]